MLDQSSSSRMMWWRGSVSGVIFCMFCMFCMFACLVVVLASKMEARQIVVLHIKLPSLS